MRRIFTVVTPECPYIKGRKVGSKDCTQCEHFRGGIVQNFVDCAQNRAEIAQKSQKIEHERKSSGRKTATAQEAHKRPKKRLKKSK